MQTLIPDEIRHLCRPEEIPDGDALGFPPAPGGFTGLMAVRQGDTVNVYLNSCPHIGTPLDWMPNRFMSIDKQFIICATHGAEFAVSTGECLKGPCKGDYLEVVPHHISDGVICVAANAGL
jgi:nitrite reductase/ring-hydroxylating ferredoxin subunit